MHGYSSKDLARSFQTVRANTIQIAEEIPEEKYGFRPAEGTRTVAETLAHLATATQWAQDLHGPRHNAVTFELFMAGMQKAGAAAAALTTKAAILDALRAGGEQVVKFLDELPEEALSERVQYPAGMQPPDKSRFEMLLSVKEHEMHHRAQLMTIERMLGITPHLTRNMQARMAEVQAQRAQGA
jgi:uncharacterized damage-inducible protein DinB